MATKKRAGKRAEPKTRVAFRFWEGEVVAIMPEIPGTTDDRTCTCYVTSGGHASCNPFRAVGESRPATREEYYKLRKEMERLGYEIEVIEKVNLKVYRETRRRKMEMDWKRQQRKRE